MSIYKTTWAKISTALLISAIVTASCNDTTDKATTTVQSTDSTTKTVTAPVTTTTTTTTAVAAPDTTIVNVTRKSKNKTDTGGRTIKNPGKMVQK